MLMNAALRDNTKRTYTSAQNRFLNFCKHYKLLPLPVSEDTLLLYVSFLFEEGLSGSSIKVYLSAVRSLHIFAGKQYPTDLHRVRMAIKGAVRETPAPNRNSPLHIQYCQKFCKKLNVDLTDSFYVQPCPWHSLVVSVWEKFVSKMQGVSALKNICV